MSLFIEYDVVHLVANFESEELSVQKGTRGTILMTFENDSTFYEVEFVDENGESVGIGTVPSQYLQKCERLN